MSRAESVAGEVRCAQCNRLVALVRPDGALEVRVRHGGEKHTTVVRGPAHMVNGLSWTYEKGE